MAPSKWNGLANLTRVVSTQPPRNRIAVKLTNPVFRRLHSNNRPPFIQIISAQSFGRCISQSIHELLGVA